MRSTEDIRRWLTIFQQTKSFTSFPSHQVAPWSWKTHGEKVVSHVSDVRRDDQVALADMESRSEAIKLGAPAGSGEKVREDDPSKTSPPEPPKKTEGLETTRI